MQAVQNVQGRKIPKNILTGKAETIIGKTAAVVKLPIKNPEPHKTQVIVQAHARRQQKVKDYVINAV